MGISDLKRVLLSSSHSSVIDALMKEDYEPENILSFDSHLDVDIVGALETVWNAVRGYNGYDKGLHFALTDSAIHMLARKWFPNTEIKILLCLLTAKTFYSFPLSNMAKFILSLYH